MKEFYHRHLPHWQPHGAVFFVTFRLKNSLPYEIVESLRREREHQNTFDEQVYFEKWASYLDKAESGPRWLAQPEIADVVKEALLYRDGKVFDLHAFSIMPNHVHVVFEPQRRSEWHSEPLSKSDWLRSVLKGQSDSSLSLSDYQAGLPLFKIMQSLKRHTARQANLILGREGAFWQDESYDRVMRDQDEYIRTMHYVLENPVKAGLVSRWEEWKWTYCKPGIFG
jgi:REP element-mobilizing transposase RayT